MVRTVISLPDSLFHWLKQEALRRNVSQAHLVRIALQFWRKHNGKTAQSGSGFDGQSKSAK